MGRRTAMTTVAAPIPFTEDYVALDADEIAARIAAEGS
jgi:hypothetical protein